MSLCSYVGILLDISGTVALYKQNRRKVKYPDGH